MELASIRPKTQATPRFLSKPQSRTKRSVLPANVGGYRITLLRSRQETASSFYGAELYQTFCTEIQQPDYGPLTLYLMQIRTRRAVVLHRSCAYSSNKTTMHQCHRLPTPSLFHHWNMERDRRPA